MKKGILLAALSAVFLFVSQPVRAEEQAPEPEPQTEVQKQKAFKYKEEGRRDPFLSIITAAKQAQQIKPKGATPLEEYDMSQITLSAIIWTKDGYYALVGLPDGRHFTIKNGTPIGIHSGKVIDITGGMVVVSQKVRDYKGHLQTEEYTLRLRGEEAE